MRLAVLYDIHGNLPALGATLAEVDALQPDLIVMGGDVAGGPMPRATLDRLLALGDRARFVMGNGDREMVSFLDGEPTREQNEGPFDASLPYMSTTE
jgi:3',5'-cyclic AMP phosphodiesterase CpdA